MHGDATSSFKQNQFGEANVQLTFHEADRRNIGGVDCVYVELISTTSRIRPRTFCWRVIPNRLTGNMSKPRTVYVLRWIAGRRAGVTEFDPLYTIE
jgi:hypothetical protein